MNGNSMDSICAIASPDKKNVAISGPTTGRRAWRAISPKRDAIRVAQPSVDGAARFEGGKLSRRFANARNALNKQSAAAPSAAKLRPYGGDDPRHAAEFAQQAAHDRPEDETQAEGGADQAHPFRTFLGRSHVRDVRVRGRNVSAKRAGQRAGYKQKR